MPRRSFTTPDVVAVLEGIIAETGIEPANVRCDNGPEFTAEALISWCATAGVKTAFIDPGLPWQDGFIESFNAQFRREQLAGEIIDTMAEAKYLVEEYRSIYNQERPHGCQRPLGTPHRRPTVLPAGGHEKCPVVASWFARSGWVRAGHSSGSRSVT